jgi:hypothetical protein
MNDTTQKPEADWHPKIKDMVYHAMDWIDKKSLHNNTSKHIRLIQIV